MGIFGRKNKGKNKTSYSTQRNDFDPGEGTGINQSNKGSKIIGVPGNEVSSGGRTPEKTISLESKKATEIKAPKSEAPELKKSTQKTKETAAEYRARRAQELADAKQAMVNKQKAVTASKAKNADQDTPDVEVTSTKKSPGSEETQATTTRGGYTETLTQAELDAQNRGEKPTSQGITWNTKTSGDTSGRIYRKPGESKKAFDTRRAQIRKASESDPNIT